MQNQLLEDINDIKEFPVNIQKLLENTSEIDLDQAYRDGGWILW